MTIIMDHLERPHTASPQMRLIEPCLRMPFGDGEMALPLLIHRVRPVRPDSFLDLVGTFYFPKSSSAGPVRGQGAAYKS